MNALHGLSRLTGLAIGASQRLQLNLGPLGCLPGADNLLRQCTNAHHTRKAGDAAQDVGDTSERPFHLLAGGHSAGLCAI